MPAPQTPDHNFSFFAGTQEYIQEAYDLIARKFQDLPNDYIHIDVASGEGLVSRTFRRFSLESGKKGTVIGIEPDPYALQQARESVSSSPLFVAKFIQGRAQDIKKLVAGEIPKGGANSASILGAIHEFKGEGEQEAALAALFDKLQPGAPYFQDSAFTSEAQKTREYGIWKLDLIKYLGTTRDKTIEAIRTLSPEKHEEKITDAGFKIIYRAIKSVMLSRQALEAISMYPEFIAGFFRDIIGQEKYSLREKSELIILSLHRTLEKLGVDGFPRTWHEVIAIRPLSAAA